jgi:hypothetical protein
MPEALQETLGTDDPLFFPDGVVLKRSHKQQIDPQCVGAVYFGHLVRRDHIASRLGHAGHLAGPGIAGVHDSLAAQYRERLTEGNDACVGHHLGPEASVQQVHNGVLCAAHVQIGRSPLSQSLRIEGAVVIVRTDEAQKVPTGTGKAVQGVGFTPPWATTFWAGGVDELGHVGQR